MRMVALLVVCSVGAEATCPSEDKLPNVMSSLLECVDATDRVGCMQNKDACSYSDCSNRFSEEFEYSFPVQDCHSYFSGYPEVLKQECDMSFGIIADYACGECPSSDNLQQVQHVTTMVECMMEDAEDDIVACARSAAFCDRTAPDPFLWRYGVRT